MKSWSVLFRGRSAGLSAASLAGLVLFPIAAAAQPAVASLEQRLTGAERVVVATARSIEARWEHNVHGDRLIVSRVRLEVNETLKGTPTDNLWLDLEGGTLDGLTLRVSSLPALKSGDRAVFFLERGQAGAHRPHLRGQGILQLDADDKVRGSKVSLDDIRGRARGVAR